MQSAANARTRCRSGAAFERVDIVRQPIAFMRYSSSEGFIMTCRGQPTQLTALGARRYAGLATCHP